MKKAWLAGLLALAWMAFSSYWYLCKTCGCCGDVPAISAVIPSVDPYQFNVADKADFTENALFGAWKTKTLLGGGMGDTLVVTGFYGKNEAIGEKLGLQRAEVLKSKLVGAWDAARIFCRARMVPDLKLPGMASEISWLKAKIDQNSSTIISQGGQTIILFPFRSAVKEVDAKVDAFLREMIAREKATTSKITITGHTDNVGEEGPNQKLGQARADFIKKMLVRGGIAAARVSTDSKGEMQPVGSNEDDAGRHQNRRVVLTVTP